MSAAVAPGQGWVVIRRAWWKRRTAPAWFTLELTFARTRRAAIAEYNATWAKPGEFARARRRGDVQCVRCSLVADGGAA